MTIDIKQNVKNLIASLFHKEEREQVVTNKFARLRQLVGRRNKFKQWINILTTQGNAVKRLHAYYLLNQTNKEIRRITIKKTIKS